MVSEQDVIGYLRSNEITLTYDRRADTPHTVTTVVGYAS